MTETRTRENYSDFIDELGLVYVQGQELSAEDLANLVQIGESLTSQSSFLRGDAYNMARDLYGDNWLNLVDFELNQRTLANYALVCRRFPRDRRIKSKFLRFRHYDALKGIKDPDLADDWLRRADKERMNSDLLRKTIKESVPTVTRKMNEEMQVGLIDISLMEDYGIEEGTIVRVSFEIIVPANEEAEAA
jgi:hypothetical protein